jgi:hypothetical protein
MTRWMSKVTQFGNHSAIWRATRPTSLPAGLMWFASRFLTASSIVVRRWGPRWSMRHRVLGHEIGAWMLAVAWAGLPLTLLLRSVFRTFR